MKFSSRKILEEHKNCVHREKSWGCKTCKMVFPTKKNLIEHRRYVHPAQSSVPVEIHIYKFDPPNNVYTCCTCKTTFQDEEDAKSHLKGHENTFQCSMCPEVFKNIYDLGWHSASHSESHELTCPLCAYTTTNKYGLKSHINLVHFQITPYVCGTCGKGFSSLRKLENHKPEHQKKYYPCIVCNEQFILPKNLVSHQVKTHQVSSVKENLEHECPMCHRMFYKPDDVQAHMQKCDRKRKRPKKSHLCQTCGKSFPAFGKLAIHLNIHTKEKSYPCAYCHKQFFRKESLAAHERVHTGYKPYACDFCGKRFAHHSPFRVHKRTHTGEKPFVCAICKKGHITNQGLKLHMKSCKGS